MFKALYDYLTLEKEKNITKYKLFYLKLGKLSLRSVHKNILMTHIELLPNENWGFSELCFILANKKNEKIVKCL